MRRIIWVLAIALASCKTTTPGSAGQLIQVETGPCFGACPVFKMTINQDRSATYEAIKFNKDQEGTYATTLREEDFVKLQNLLQQTNYVNLQDTFRMPVTDMPSITLHIPHDGKVKNIYDYGKKGTPQLENLYQFLTDLRTTQDWK